MSDPSRLGSCPTSVSVRWARGGCQGGLTTEPEEMGQEP